MTLTEMAEPKKVGGGRRTVNPKDVITLRDWVARWPGTANLAFHPERRNPIVYSVGAPPTEVKEIPWKREADTLTVLTQRESFGSGAVAAAERRLGKYREQRAAMATSAIDQLRIAEAALLEAWHVYHAASGSTGGRGALMRDVLVAEKTLRELESALGARMAIERKIVKEENGYISVQVPVMPRALRGMDITEVE
jgi:hypothetical protein